MRELLKALLSGEPDGLAGDLPTRLVSIHLANWFRRETAQPDRVVTGPNSNRVSLCGSVSYGWVSFVEGRMAQSDYRKKTFAGRRELG